MFDLGEVDRFLRGQASRFLVFSYRNDTHEFWFERKEDGRVVAFIPIQQGDRSKDPFDITMAMKHPDCNVDFGIECSYYRLELCERWQLYTIFKVACNHLNWHDHTRMEKQYLQYLPPALTEQC